MEVPVAFARPDDAVGSDAAWTRGAPVQRRLPPAACTTVLKLIGGRIDVTVAGTVEFREHSASACMTGGRSRAQRPYRTTRAYTTAPVVSSEQAGLVELDDRD